MKFSSIKFLSLLLAIVLFSLQSVNAYSLSQPDDCYAEKNISESKITKKYIDLPVDDSVKLGNTEVLKSVTASLFFSRFFEAIPNIVDLLINISSERAPPKY